MDWDFLIVGAGLAGCTLAERVSSILGKTVLVVEKRGHIGGNAYDFYNDNGILVQKYGPHIFHSNSEKVWNYLSQFTDWHSYTHRVLACVNGKQVYLPINIETMEKLLDRKFTSQQLGDYFEENRVILRKDQIRNAKDVIVSQVGENLYELFFKYYTKKQWGIYPNELAPEVTRRLPVRFSRDTRYFTDKFQGVPKQGYTSIFEKMLDSRNIHLVLNTDYKDLVSCVKANNLIFTGPIDHYFNYSYGKLPYRSLDFEFKTFDLEQYQSVAVVNYPNDHNYTRITEFKYFYSQVHPKTTICYEYPKAYGEPYYPIPKPEHMDLYKKYHSEAEKLGNVHFVGRLAEYRYINMDQVVEEALNLFEKKKDGWC